MEKYGGCLCGDVRFLVQAGPLLSIICHCRTSRRASGAPSVAWVQFRREDVELSSGLLSTYASSAGVTRSFCRRCGTQVMYASDGSPGTIDVTTVCLDDPSLAPPTCEVWLEHRLEWEPISDTLAQHMQGSSN